MQRYFSLAMPFSIFARNVGVVSLAALVPLVALYVALQPGFAAMLLDGGPALSRFLRQVATNGFPVVFAVNYAGFFLWAWRDSGTPARNKGAVVIGTDMAMRVVLFILLHAVIYVLSADWFGSFGGSGRTALRVVAPTLARSAFFENISGAYFYATLLSALPIYATALNGSRTLPIRAGPWLAALACCGGLAGALTVVSGVLVRAQSG